MSATAKKQGVGGASGARAKGVETIDPSARGAKRALDERFPHVVGEQECVSASAGAERWALEYLACNGEIKRCEERKEIAGNHLKLEIGARYGIEWFAFQASWAERVGNVDWQAVCAAHGISEEMLEQYRGEGSRVLRVTKKGE